MSEERTVVLVGDHLALPHPDEWQREHFNVGEHRLVRAVVGDSEDEKWMCFDHGWECWATPKLHPGERIALKVASTQAKEGRPTDTNVVSMLCMTIERLAGISDWTQEVEDDEYVKPMEGEPQEEPDDGG